MPPATPKPFQPDSFTKYLRRALSRHASMINHWGLRRYLLITYLGGTLIFPYSYGSAEVPHLLMPTLVSTRVGNDALVHVFL